MRFKTTHYYIAPVHTDDEHAYEPTHCSIGIHPHILWAIFKYLLTAWIIQAINKEIQKVCFRFIETGWLNVRDADAEVAEGVILEEGLSAFDDMTHPLWTVSNWKHLALDVSVSIVMKNTEQDSIPMRSASWISSNGSISHGSDFCD